MRYLVEKLHDSPGKPWHGKPRCGSGPDSGCFLWYANVNNVIRFGLAQAAFKPGQYDITPWPEGTSPPSTKPTRAYKRA